MTGRKLYVGLLTAGVSVFALTGCAMQHPNAMPSGYTHHNKTYKSATPPPSKKITKQQRQHMDAMQAEQFRDAVYGLLKRVTNRAGMPPKPVYILAPDPMTPFYANIDNDLREGMRHLGYAISDSPIGAYVFAYDARLINKSRSAMSAGNPNVELVVKVFNKVGEDARMLTEEIGHYYIKGAEVLHIKPSHYTLLPSREKIMRQIDGFLAPDDPRTASDEKPVPASEAVTMREKMLQAHGSQPIVEEEDGPSQAVPIDNSASSYNGGHTVNREPLMPRARVSNHIEY